MASTKYGTHSKPEGKKYKKAIIGKRTDSSRDVIRRFLNRNVKVAL